MVSERLVEGTLLNDRYRIVRALGKGGMGTVYLAEHVRLDTIVAVKEVKAQSGEEDQDRRDLERCEQEARFLVRLNHPHLPKVTDAFLENDRFYLVMEYIEGVTLESLKRDQDQGAGGVIQVIDWGLQIADVLSYLHSQEPPIIFRDMKPANVMLQPDGVIRLIDFGIARRFQPGAKKDTALLGSVGYSPPEQFGKQQTDTRSDIYAFGATLHHLLTGRDPASQPFKFPPARSINPDVPESLSRLLAECLAMDPEFRPQDMKAVIWQLNSIHNEMSAPATETANLASGRRIVSSQLAQYEARRSRKKTYQAHGGSIRSALAVSALIVLGAVTYALFHAHRASSPHKPPLVMPMMGQGIPLSPPHDDPLPADDAGTSTPPQTDASTVGIKIGSVEQEQGAYLLPCLVHGILRGHANSAATLAIFVYAADGSPINAVDRNSTYANPDGQLSVATRLTVSSDIQPYNIRMVLPLRQFPPQALATAARVRAMLAVDGLKFYSDLVDLTLNLDSGSQPVGTNGDPSQTGGAGHETTPGSSTDTGAGIIGGH